MLRAGIKSWTSLQRALPFTAVTLTMSTSHFVRVVRFLVRFEHPSIRYLSQNAKRASARKDTGLDQSLFSVQLFRLRINIMKVCIRDQIRAI